MGERKKLRPPRKFKVTRGWLRRFSNDGWWTPGQFAALGISWPPPKTWFRKHVGRLITREAKQQFEHARTGNIRADVPSLGGL
jgi:hypothetical protein